MIICPPLVLGNGSVEYSSDGAVSGGIGVFSTYGTIATHSCNDGFVLTVGDVERTCGDGNGVHGEWSGMAAGCECKYVIILILVSWLSHAV